NQVVKGLIAIDALVNSIGFYESAKRSQVQLKGLYDGRKSAKYRVNGVAAGGMVKFIVQPVEKHQAITFCLITDIVSQPGKAVNRQKF
ncbi:MAG: hypothetical protein WAK12_09500, partial [Acidimicrobiales bacterium]